MVGSIAGGLQAPARTFSPMHQLIQMLTSFQCSHTPNLQPTPSSWLCSHTRLLLRWPIDTHLYIHTQQPLDTHLHQPMHTHLHSHWPIDTLCTHILANGHSLSYLPFGPHPPPHLLVGEGQELSSSALLPMKPSMACPQQTRSRRRAGQFLRPQIHVPKQSAGEAPQIAQKQENL